MIGSNWQKTVYLNGEYLPLSEAKISVFDRGFLFGDGVYEVIPAYMGVLFRIEDHFARLQKSLDSIGLDFHYDTQEWLNILHPLLNKKKDQYIYLQITRGVTPKREHSFPEKVTPTIFAMCSDIEPFEGVISGAKAITMDDSRWKLCNIKTTSLLANILLRQEAIEQSVAEAILHKKGIITEGAASNLFAVIDGVLVTPKPNERILLGITRTVILELAENNSIPWQERDISLAELKEASEVWITSSTREIVPIIELDGRSVGTGARGDIWCKMNQLFQQYKQS